MPQSANSYYHLLKSISMKPCIFLNLGTLVRYSATACKVTTKQTYIQGSNKSEVLSL